MLDFQRLYAEKFPSTIEGINRNVREAQPYILKTISSATMINRWQMAAIVLIILYVAGVCLFLPLATLSIIRSPPLPMHEFYNLQYMTIELNIANSANRDHFIAGDLARFSFNVTNTYSRPATFDYNSSVTFLGYGCHRNFNLDSNQSKNITELLLVSYEGNNGFRFQIVQKIEENQELNYSIPIFLVATSLSDELSLYFYKSTFLLTMIVGIPAIIYGVKQFVELGEKKKSEAKI